MIRYTGRADQCEVTVIVMGDGTTKSLSVNLTKSPYNLNFTNNPVAVAAFASTPVQSSAGPPSETYTSSTDKQLNIKSVDLVQGKLQIEFNDAPEKCTLDGPVPRTRLDIYFIYETSPTGDIFIGPFTVSIQADQILLAGHGLVNGDQIKFVLEEGNSLAALPFPLNDVAYYFVVGARGNDFQVSSVVGGAVINLTDKGVGANTVWKKN